MSAKSNIKYILLTIQPASIAMIAAGVVGLYVKGVDGLFSAPVDLVQVASASAVTLGSLSYLVEQGYLLTN